MKKTRFWLSLAAALTGGACITLGNPALASVPMMAPPASAGMTEEQKLESALPPTPIAADHFDNGPCWEDGTVAGSDYSWMDNYDEAWSYRYNAYEAKYAERFEEPAAVQPETEPADEAPTVADSSSEYGDYWQNDYYDEKYYDDCDDEAPAEETYTATDTDETDNYQCEYGDDCYWDDDFYCSDHDAEVVEARTTPADEQYVDYWEDDYCNYGCECYNDEFEDEAANDAQPIATDDPMYDEYYTEYWEEDAYNHGDGSYGEEQVDEMAISDEADDSQGVAEVQDAAEAYEYSYDYEYDYEPGYESEYGYECDYGDEGDEAVITHKGNESTYEEDYADYWEDDYYDYQEEAYAEEMAADESVASDSDAGSYGFEDAYGYEYYDQQPMDDSTDVSDAGESWSYDYYDEESYGSEDSYYDEYGEYEYAAPQERYGSAESAAEMSDEALYDGYSEAYPYEEYAYPDGMSESMGGAYSDDSMDGESLDNDEASELVNDSWDAEDEYWEAYENEHMLRGDYNYEVLYGEVSDEIDPYDVPAEDAMFDDEETNEFDSYDALYDDADVEPEAVEMDLQGDFGLIAQRPFELLALADQEILQALQQTAGDATRIRRARFAEHLEGLGWQAIDFAFRFEDVTGREVLGLTEELPAVAAFLAVFRQVERGEMGMDEGVGTLRRSVDDLTLDWIEGVDQITADAYQTWEDRQLAESDRQRNDPTELSNLVVEAVMTAATEKLGELGERILGLSQKLAELGWSPVGAEPVEDAAISQASAPEIPVTR